MSEHAWNERGDRLCLERNGCRKTPRAVRKLRWHIGPRLSPRQRVVRLARVEPGQLELADKVLIQGLEVFANHGVYPEENTLGQKFGRDGHALRQPAPSRGDG